MGASDPPPVALTIAGSDSSGGAGIQADLKTFHAFGVYGMSVVTALTAQNTEGVSEIVAVDPAFVTAQIEAVARDIPPDAVKTGMLANAAIVEAVAAAVERRGLGNLVVDPVMVATTGARLLEPDAVAALRRVLLPAATLLTPNGPEAAILTGRRVETPADQEAAARAIVDAGAAAVLVKGGDLEGVDVIDVFHDGERLERFRDRRLDTRSTHGSGCALASAIAASLANGSDLRAAIVRARAWVRRGIERAPGLGRGRGPLDLFGDPGPQ